MSELDRLNREHEKAIATLQDGCPHEVTSWEEVIYMPGGVETELSCARCGRTLAQRGECYWCKEPIVTGIRGDVGLVSIYDAAARKKYPGLMGGVYYHRSCAEAVSAEYLKHCHAEYTELEPDKKSGHVWSCNQLVEGHGPHHTGKHDDGRARTWDGERVEVVLGEKPR